MQDLNNVIKAFECLNGPYTGNHCDKCMYGYEYFDDSGDGPGWWRCNEEKLGNDMYSWLKIYQYLMENK